VFPITFVLLACEEASEHGNTSRLLDLRILSNDPNIMGRSWCVKGAGKDGKPLTRADCVKFLEMHAKFSIANAMKRGVDEIEFIESSGDELAMAASFDEQFRANLQFITPTLAPKLARTLVQEASVNQIGLEFEELADWPARNADVTD